MSLLNESIQSQVRQMLEKIEAPVKLLMFTQGEGGALECDMCADTRQLITEIADLSDKLRVEIKDFVADANLAEVYKIDKIPAIVVLPDEAEPKDYGVRLFGIPAGYEFSTLIEDILMVGRREAGLSPQTMTELNRLDRPVHIQVFVTPTCPYCPQAVVLAHKLALASDWVTADMVEATEFPHLANKYQVFGVPRTVINEVIHFEGAVPESQLLPRLMTVLDDQEMELLKSQE
jgi:glutaredoxin-like protein